MSAKRGPRVLRLVGLTLVVLALLTPLEWMPYSPSDLLLRELRNYGHVPLFALLGPLLMLISRTLFGERLSPVAHAAVALAAAAVLGAGSEAIQYFLPRDADVDDVLRDLAGAGAGLCLMLSLAPHGPGALGRGQLRFLLRAAAAVLLLGAFVPVLALSDAERERNDRFPVLLDFESEAQLTFVHTRAAVLDREPAPRGWDHSGTVGRLRFGGTHYPQLTLREPVADWRGFARLCLALYSEEPEPVTVVLAVQDALWNRKGPDRFHQRIVLDGGAVEACFPMSGIVDLDSGRALRLDAIATVNLYAVRPGRQVTVWLDDLELR